MIDPENGLPVTGLSTTKVDLTIPPTVALSQTFAPSLGGSTSSLLIIGAVIAAAALIIQTVKK